MPDHFDAYYEWLGIPPKDQPPTYYRLLGVDAGESNLRVIENAADRQMAHIRTFQTGKHSAISQKLLNQIASAKVCLLNAEKKAAYDLQLAAKAAAKEKLSADSAARVAKPLAAQSVAQFVAALPATSASNATLAELDAVIDRSSHRKTVRQKAIWQRPAILGGVAVALLALAVGVYVFLRPSVDDDTNESPQVAVVPALPVVASASSTKPLSPDAQSAQVGTEDAADIAVAVPDDSSESPNSDLNSAATIADPPQKSDSQPASPPAREVEANSTRDSRAIDENDAVNMPSVATDDEPEPEEAPPAVVRPGQAASGRPRSSTPKPTVARPAEIASGPQKVGKPINLLKSVNVARDTLSGSFQFDGKSLVGSPGARDNVVFEIAFPFQPAGEYEITVVAEPVMQQSLDEAIQIGWRAGRETCGIAVGNTRSGLSGNWTGNGRSTGQRDLFGLGRKTTLVVTVLSSGVTLSANDRELRFHPDSQRFVGSRGGAAVQALTLNWGWPGFRVTRFDVQPFKTRKVAAADAVASKSSPSGQPVLVTTREITANRTAVPSTDDQTRAAEQVRDVFKAEFAKAKKPEEKTDLAEKLLQQGIDTQDDLVASYVLLKEARDMAAGAGNLPLSVRVVETLTEKFEVDRFDALQQAVADAAKHIPAEPGTRLALVDTALELMNVAAAAGRFESAGKFATVAGGMATKLKDAALKKRVQSALADVKKQKVQFTAIKLLQDTLAERPDDADANFKFGKHLCLVQGDWEKGLPHLAKAGDEKFAPLAQQELAKLDAAEAQVKLADAWWDLSASEPAANKPALMARAGHWYQIALPEISGLGKVKIEKRLEQIAPVEKPGPAEPPAAKIAVARSGVKPRTGKVGAESPLFGRTDKMAAGDLDRHVATKLLMGPVSVGIMQPGLSNTDRYLNSGEAVPPGEWRIHHLQLYQENQITDADLDAIGRLESLRQLTIDRQNISDAGMVHLGQLKAIRLLSVHQAPITDRAAQSIAGLATLESLTLTRSQITDVGLSRLAALSGLKYVTLAELSIGGPGIKSLGKLPVLQNLTLSNIQLSDAQLAPLANLKQLRTLSIVGAPLTGECFRSFAPDAMLANLGLRDTKLNDAGMKLIANIQSLQSLEIQGSAMNEAGLKHLATLNNLRTLGLSHIQFPDRAILSLAELHNVRDLSLTDCSFNGEAFRNSKTFDQLTHVRFYNSKISDAGLKYIVAAMPNLETLDLGQTPITDAGAKHLASLKRLRYLYLYNTGIGDKGAMELAGLSVLQNLTLPRAGVSPATVEKLCAALRGCSVDLN